MGTRKPASLVRAMSVVLTFAVLALAVLLLMSKSKVSHEDMRRSEPLKHITQGMPTEEVVRALGPPTLEEHATFIIDQDVPHVCKHVARTVLIYRRQPPANSTYVFLDQHGRVACTAKGLLFSSAD
jgi:hypothetical protein